MSDTPPGLLAEVADTETALLSESLDALLRIDCQFWACEGPTLEPLPMRTCFRCSLIARLEAFGVASSSDDPIGGTPDV